MKPILLAAAALPLALTLGLSGCSVEAPAAADSSSSSSGDADHWRQCAEAWHTVAQDAAQTMLTEHEAFGHMKDAVTSLYNGDVSTATDDVNAATDSLDQVDSQAQAISAETPTDCE